VNSSGELERFSIGDLTFFLGDGFLHSIRYRGVELVQRIYFSYRDENWIDVPAVYEAADLQQVNDEIQIAFTGVVRSENVGFTADFAVGASQDRLRVSFTGRVSVPSLRNRLGLCVLLPETLAGAVCRRWSPAGELLERMLPERIEPHQPLFDIRRIEVDADVATVCLEFDGEVFEMEDQRNWTDTSFKIYCTPLALPRPVRIETDERVSQSVEVSIRPHTWNALPYSAPVCIDLSESEASQLPRLGTDLTYVSFDDSSIDSLRIPKCVELLRVDADLEAPGWKARLQRIGEFAHDYERSLWLTLCVPLQFSLGGVREALEPFSDSIDTVSITANCDPWGTSERMLQALRGIRQEMRGDWSIGAGTIAWFTQANRQAPGPDDFDTVFFSATPQVHQFDDASLMLHSAGLASVGGAASFLWPGKRVHLGPVTLRPRFFAKPGVRGPGVVPQFKPDPRTGTPIGTAWTAAAVSAFLRAGVEEVSLFELTGPGGIDLPNILRLIELIWGAGATGPVESPTIFAHLPMSVADGTVAAFSVPAGPLKDRRLFLVNRDHEAVVIKLSGYQKLKRAFVIGGDGSIIEQGGSFLQFEILPFQLVIVEYV
jgi:D-apionolactonase